MTPMILTVLPNALGPWYGVVCGVFGLAAAWFTARWAWQAFAPYDDDLADKIEYAFMVVLFTVTAGGITFIAWPVLAMVGAAAGLVWLFAQTAKPGRFRLSQRRQSDPVTDDIERRKLERRIRQLEAELDIREGA